MDDPLDDEVKSTASPLLQKMLDDTVSMARYLLDSGAELDTEKIAKLDVILGVDPISHSEDIAMLHQYFSSLVRPAIPRGIRYISPKPLDQSSPPPTPKVVIQMGIANSLFLIGFIIFGAWVDPESLDAEPLYRAGSEQLLISAWYLCAAGIGACFYNLLVMYDFIRKDLYDPKYYASYWIRLGLGLIAGYLLAEVIPKEYSFEGNLRGAVLALIGGFSAEVVDWVLKRFVATLRTLIQGSTSALITERETTLKLQMATELKKAKLEAGDEIRSLRSKLIDKEQLSEAEIKEFDELIKNLA